MEKLKNMFNPGKQQDDETLYGSGQNTGNTGGVTGEGSHLASSTENTSGLPGSQTTGTTGTSGIGSASTGVPSEASTDQSGRAIGSGTTTGSSGLGGQGSHLSGARDPTSTTASRLEGNQTSGLGNTSTTAGTRQPDLARDAATTAAATTSGNTGFAQQPGSQHGSGRKLGTNTVTPAAVGSHEGSSHMPGSWDDSYDRSGMGSRTTSTGPGSTTNTGYPTTAQDTSHLGNTGSSVPTQGTNPSTGSHLGRDAAAIGTAGTVGEGIHHHRENERNLSSSTGTGSTGYPNTTQDTRQPGSNTGYGNTTLGSTTGAGSHLGRDAAALGTTGAVGEGIHHHRENEEGLGSARVLGTTTSHSTRLPSGSPITSTTLGTEHSGYTSTLPDRTLDSQQPGSTTGYGSSNTGNPSSGHHLGRDAAAVGTAGALGGAALHHRDDERNLRDQYAGSSATQPGGEYTGTTREMPLGSGTRQTGTPASQPIGSNTGYGSTQNDNTSSGHHLGRDAAALGTAGAVGEGIHHHRVNERENERGFGSSGVTSASNTYGSSSGPHQTDTANLLDPNISGGSRRTEDARKHHPQHGGGAEAADKHHSSDAAPALSGAAAGAIGLGEYERNKHSNDRTGGVGNTSTTQPSSSTTSRADPTSTGATGRDHHYGRDAAIGTGGVGAAGLAAHEYEKRENDRGTGIGNTSSSNNPATTTSTSRTDPATYSSTTSGDHHYGRDAAIGAGGVGAAGLAAHEYGRHENDRGTGVGNTSTTTNPATSSASRTDPYASSTSQDHHYGRDAAVGAGGVGAAGLAGREYEKHHGDRSSGVGGSSTTTNPATTSSTSRTDPATSSTSTSKDHHYGRDAAIGAGGVGAAGLAGHEYEKHHGDNAAGTSGLSQSTSGPSSLPGPAPNTAGPHSKDWMNKLDPRVIANPTVAQGNPQAESTLASQKPSAETGGYGASSNTSGHHYGRDAAVAGGVGGVAAPLAHENEKRRLEKLDNQDTNPLSNPGASGVTGHSPRDSATGNTTQNTSSLGDNDRSKDHHYGRDAAVAGGVGTAAYEADKHKHDKDLSQAEKAAKKQQKHDEKEFEKERKHDQKQYEKDMEKQHKHDEKAAKKESKGGLFGFLHRDKNKKYTPEEEAEFDRQEREHNSHKGRDTALAGAGAGALGAGAYEAEKHHHSGTDTDKPLPYAPGNRGVGTGAGTQNALAGDNTTSGQSGHHYGRDAALGTGAAGAAGYAAHEHDKTHGTPLADKPVGQDLGDKLHGAERNRGVTGTSGVPGTEGYGSGSHVHSEASTDQYGNPIDSGVVASGTGRDYPTGSHVPSEASTDQYGNPIDETRGTSGHQGHHYGRDAALGTGAAGAAGVAAHEHHKHESGYQPSSSTGYDNRTSGSGSTGQYDNTSSGYGGSQGQTGHHTGRDAAALGGAGALGEHEYRKHDTTSGQHQPGSGLTGSNTSGQYDNTGLGYGQQQTGTTGTDDYGASDAGHKGIGPSVSSATGRNRLHKDPPASHPASHIPGSGGETERMMQEGKQDMHGDTGVANNGNDRVNY